MFKKIVLAAVAASTGVLFFAACGGDDCQTAADNIVAKYKSCGATQSSTSSSSSTSGSSSCTAAQGTTALAQAKCITDATCDTLKGTDLMGLATLGTCLQQASSAGGTSTSSGSGSTGTGG